MRGHHRNKAGEIGARRQAEHEKQHGYLRECPCEGDEKKDDHRHGEAQKDRPLVAELTGEDARGEERRRLAERKERDEAGSLCMADDEFILDEGQDWTKNGPYRHDEKPQRPEQQEKGETSAPYGGVA